MSQRQIVPVKGNTRVESGAVVFEYDEASYLEAQDWPGYFLRGKHALELAAAITTLLHSQPATTLPDRVDTEEQQRQFQLHVARQILQASRDTITNDVAGRRTATK